MKNSKDEAPDNPEKNKGLWWPEGGCRLETVPGVFPKEIPVLAWEGGEAQTPGPAGVGGHSTLTLHVSGAEASYPGAGAW